MKANAQRNAFAYAHTQTYTTAMTLPCTLIETCLSVLFFILFNISAEMSESERFIIMKTFYLPLLVHEEKNELAGVGKPT